MSIKQKVAATIAGWEQGLYTLEEFLNIMFKLRLEFPSGS